MPPFSHDTPLLPPDWSLEKERELGAAIAEHFHSDKHNHRRRGHKHFMQFVAKDCFAYGFSYRYRQNLCRLIDFSYPRTAEFINDIAATDLLHVFPTMHARTNGLIECIFVVDWLKLNYKPPPRTDAIDQFPEVERANTFLSGQLERTIKRVYGEV